MRARSVLTGDLANVKLFLYIMRQNKCAYRAANAHVTYQVFFTDGLNSIERWNKRCACQPKRKELYVLEITFTLCL